MSEPPRKRGRPREFDEASALVAASHAFLRLGYAGASLETLASEMGLAKPSLYAAFGDKHALYMRVLEERYRMVTARYGPAFVRGATLEESLRNVFDECIEICLGVNGGPPGCPIAAAQTTESLVDDDVMAFTQRFRSEIDVSMAKAIARRLSSAPSPSTRALATTIARLTNGILHDLALRARVGEPRAKLRDLSRSAARLLANAAARGEV